MKTFKKCLLHNDIRPLEVVCVIKCHQVLLNYFIIGILRCNEYKNIIFRIIIRIVNIKVTI